MNMPPDFPGDPQVALAASNKLLNELSDKVDEFVRTNTLDPRVVTTCVMAAIGELVNRAAQAGDLPKEKVLFQIAAHLDGRGIGRTA